METVLGLSVTATHVQTVLVEGHDATGATLEHDDFEVFTPDIPVAHASERVAEAVLSIAAADGHQLRTIAVTWSEDADMEAALVLDCLSEVGFGETVPVVAVGARHAAEALAHSIGEVIGYRRTAVCVVEPESVLLSLIDTATGGVATLSTRAVRSVDALAEWVGSVFVDQDWHPDGVFLVGSITGLSVMADQLAADLGVPVFDPPGAELALAHGAALASGTDPVFNPAPMPQAPGTPAAPRTAALALTMMTAGAAAIVVSTSLLVSPALLPDRQPVAAREVVQFREAAAPEPPAAPPVRVTVPAESAAPAEPTAPADPPTEETQLAVRTVPEAPAAVEPPADIPAPVAEMPPPIEAPAAVEPAPPVLAPPVAQVPYGQPRLRDRILDRLGGLNRFGRGD